MIGPLILDTETGQIERGFDGMGGLWWAEGNGSCDCNRAICFGLYPVCGERRYWIIEEYDGYTVEELNGDRPHPQPRNWSQEGF